MRNVSPDKLIHLGSDEILTQFKMKLQGLGLKSKVRAQRAGCLDVCEKGASVVIYPDAVWYGNVAPDDVDEILNSHIVGGAPVRRLQILEENS